MQYKNKHTKYLVATILTLVFFVSLFGYGIYRYHWQGSFTYALSAAVPYPAVLVDWEAVRYRTYLDELRTLERYWDKQRDNSNVFVGIPNTNEIRERLVKKLVEEKIVQIWARQNNVAVSEEDIDREWQRVQNREIGSTEVQAFLDSNYGWSAAKFKARVLAPFLLQQKVKMTLAAERSGEDKKLADRAEEVYVLASKPKADFSELAKTYSDDRQSARLGGDIGYFPRGTFEPEVEKAIFSLKIGDISPPLKSSYGYHIIMLTDILYDDQAAATQASAKQILIKSFDFDEWLEQQISQTAVYRLVL